MAGTSADRESEAPSGWPGFACALLFWLVVPLPLWLLGAGFAGEWLFLPDSWSIGSVLLTAAFYAPPALMAYVSVDALRRASSNKGRAKYRPKQQSPAQGSLRRGSELRAGGGPGPSPGCGDETHSELRDALQRLWVGEKPRLSSGGAAAVQAIEGRYGLSMPRDFAAYLGEAAPAGDWTDDRGFTWWDTGRIRSLEEECGSDTPAAQRNAEIEAEPGAYLVFADFLYWCYAYAICCSEGPNRGRVALVGAAPDRFVAWSFTEFVNLAAQESDRLHPGGA